MQQSDEPNDPADNIDLQLKKEIDEFIDNPSNSFNFSHVIVRYADKDENFVEEELNSVN